VDFSGRWPKGYSCLVNPEQVEQPPLRSLHAYWNRKRAGRLMPTRADIDPVELRQHLGNLVLIEPVPAEDDFRYRLIGTTWLRSTAAIAQGRPCANFIRARML
jgi:hypothetical protein